MDTTVKDPATITSRKDFPYCKQAPTFVTNNVGGYDEIARWVLDFNDILYIRTWVADRY